MPLSYSFPPSVPPSPPTMRARLLLAAVVLAAAVSCAAAKTRTPDPEFECCTSLGLSLDVSNSLSADELKRYAAEVTSAAKSVAGKRDATFVTVSRFAGKAATVLEEPFHLTDETAPELEQKIRGFLTRPAAWYGWTNHDAAFKVMASQHAAADLALRGKRCATVEHAMISIGDMETFVVDRETTPGEMIAHPRRTAGEAAVAAAKKMRDAGALVGFLKVGDAKKEIREEHEQFDATRVPRKVKRFLRIDRRQAFFNKIKKGAYVALFGRTAYEKTHGRLHTYGWEKASEDVRLAWTNWQSRVFVDHYYADRYASYDAKLAALEALASTFDGKPFVVSCESTGSLAAQLLQMLEKVPECFGCEKLHVALVFDASRSFVTPHTTSAVRGLLSTTVPEVFEHGQVSVSAYFYADVLGTATPGGALEVDDAFGAHFKALAFEGPSAVESPDLDSKAPGAATVQRLEGSLTAAEKSFAAKHNVWKTRRSTCAFVYERAHPYPDDKRDETLVQKDVHNPKRELNVWRGISVLPAAGYDQPLPAVDDLQPVRDKTLTGLLKNAAADARKHEPDRQLLLVHVTDGYAMDNSPRCYCASNKNCRGKLQHFNSVPSETCCSKDDGDYKANRQCDLVGAVPNTPVITVFVHSTHMNDEVKKELIKHNRRWGTGDSVFTAQSMEGLGDSFRAAMHEGVGVGKCGNILRKE